MKWRFPGLSELNQYKIQWQLTHLGSEASKCPFFWARERETSLFMIDFTYLFQAEILCHIWKPPSLSELTPIIFHMELSHLGLEASI